MATKKDITQKILDLFNKNAEVVVRKFFVCEKHINLFFIDCLINKELFASGIIGGINKLEESKGSKEKIIDKLEKELIAVSTIKRIKEEKEIQEEIFNGGVIIQIEGEEWLLAVNTAGYSKRAITEPPTASVVRGPREGFIEDIETNISLIRRRLKTPSLAIKRLTVGERTNTSIALVYLDDIVNHKVVKELEKNIKSIDIDGVIDSYYLEELLTKSSSKFFKKLGNTEKPDVLTAKILEGRVGIIVDGSPIVLSAPFILFEDMQSPGDYYDIPQRTSFVRFVRFVGLILAILLPGMYVALQSYHYRVLPINFLISLLSSIEGISFPPILEILFVLFLFEILNEASVRMPKQLGMALSIIGALVLGDTAVQAGIITPPSIVVVAISGITLYIIPNESSEASLLRTLFTIVGGVAGFYGIFLGFIILATHLVSIQSYFAPYMAPYAPSVDIDKKDGFTKKPLSYMSTRPQSLRIKNIIRQRSKTKSQGGNADGVN
ncbi:MAG: spore germination protein [Clostridia bacterium]|nr:spore germination protein [Clostridia bacterium]